MTENACKPLTDEEFHTHDERTLWGVNNLVEMDRHDLIDSVVDEATPPAAVRRGNRAAHRVAHHISRAR